jgi:hypothetical protein
VGGRAGRCADGKVQGWGWVAMAVRVRAKFEFNRSLEFGISDEQEVTNKWANKNNGQASSLSSLIALLIVLLIK